MTRAYALALGAGTQVLTLGVGPAVFGPGELTTDLSLGAGWVINLAVAEYVIRRAAARRAPVAARSRWARRDRARDPPAAGRLRAAGQRPPRPALVAPSFGGLTLAHDADGTTTLTGAVADQAELHGILTRIRDLGVTLISVTPALRATTRREHGGGQNIRLHIYMRRRMLTECPSVPSSR